MLEVMLVVLPEASNLDLGGGADFRQPQDAAAAVALARTQDMVALKDRGIINHHVAGPHYVDRTAATRASLQTLEQAVGNRQVDPGALLIRVVPFDIVAPVVLLLEHCGAQYSEQYRSGVATTAA